MNESYFKSGSTDVYQAKLYKPRLLDDVCPEKNEKKEREEREEKRE